MSNPTKKKDQAIKRKVDNTTQATNKKIKANEAPKTKNYGAEYNQNGYDAPASSKSSSSGSGGSVLSVTDLTDSDPTIIDFDCRAMDINDFCLRRNKVVPFRTVFKKISRSKPDFDLRKDDMLAKQYKIIKMMGKGTFSQVYLCKDVLVNRKIALKVFTQRNQASLVKIEQNIAMHLKRLDPNDQYGFVKMLDSFRCKNQFFLVYESLGPSLYDFMAKIRKAKYTLKEIREISRQMVETMHFLHSQKIIHTDIKPENILFIEPVDAKNQLKNTKIKIIDFGSSIRLSSDDKRNFGTVTTRHYRAPEVLMKVSEGWSYPIDVFSIGITIFEMHTQKLLFPSVINNLQHFVIMTYTLGQLPSMYQKQKPNYFNHLTELDESESKKHKSFDKYFNVNDPDEQDLMRFLQRMVIYDPAKRATFEELMNDSFLKGG